MKGIRTRNIFPTVDSLLEQKSAADLRALAYELSHDRTTGLISRAAFTMLVRGIAPAAYPLDVLGMDFIGFKEINDRHTYMVGDAVLARCGTVLQASVRPGDLVARVGGDEFAIVTSVGYGALVWGRVEGRLRSENALLREEGAPYSLALRHGIRRFDTSDALDAAISDTLADAKRLIPSMRRAS